MNEYKKMTMQELEAAGRQLAEKKAEIRSEQRKVNAEIAGRTAKKNAKNRVGAMSDTEKAAMRQALGPGSVRRN